MNLLYLQIKEYPVKTGRFVRCFKTEIEQMKIALIGYGKMGHAIEQIALQRGHEIVSVIDVNNQEDFMSDAFKSADVAI